MTGRLVLSVAVLVVWFGGLGARLHELQLLRHGEFVARAEGQQQKIVHIKPPRGRILDARGRDLAISLEVDSAWADPRKVVDPRATAATLAGELGISTSRLAETLQADRDFVWVARQLDRPRAAAIEVMGLRGIDFRKERKRYYPLRELAAPVLGFAGIDGDGLEGVEAQYEPALAGAEGETLLALDARFGRFARPGPALRDPQPGADLWLTIDASIQHIVERELNEAVERKGAKSGVAVVLDPMTGAVLAMASAPGFDPNWFDRFPKRQWRNRVIADAYEPGSTFKVVAMAAALEHQLIDANDTIDCERGGIAVAGKRIADHQPFAELSVREVLAKSSNVGIIKIGSRVGAEALLDAIEAFGFGRPTGIDLPGEASGVVRSLDRWNQRSVAYVSFGQEISVTALQLANAFAVIANGGELLKPYVVSAVRQPDGEIRDLRPVPEVIDRPIASSTALTLERMLEAVVSEGTGRAAAVPGYRVAGKTGTAQKAIPAIGYSADKFIASFVGFAPARAPRLVCLVAIDEPSGAYHGGEVAAPVFSRIVEQTLLYLGVKPHREPWPGSTRPEAGSFAERPPAGGGSPSLDGAATVVALNRLGR